MRFHLMGKNVGGAAYEEVVLSGWAGRLCEEFVWRATEAVFRQFVLRCVHVEYRPEGKPVARREMTTEPRPQAS